MSVSGILALDSPDPDGLRVLTLNLWVVTGRGRIAARDGGVSWEEIGAVTGVTAEQARTEFVESFDRQELVRPSGTAVYRAVL